MSLTDTFVYCTNEKFLGTKYNTINFPNGFVCFDDDDPPEAVIAIGPGTETIEDAKAYLTEMLTKLKVPFTGKIRYHHRSGRCFGENITRTKEAYSFWVNINGPIPVEVYPENVQYEDNWRGCLEGSTVPEHKRHYTRTQIKR